MKGKKVFTKAEIRTIVATHQREKASSIGRTEIDTEQNA